MGSAAAVAEDCMTRNHSEAAHRGNAQPQGGLHPAGRYFFG